MQTKEDFLKKAIEINEGKYTLYNLCNLGGARYFTLYDKYRLEAIEEILKQDPDCVNAYGPFKETPLMKSIMVQDSQTVELLLKHGAIVTPKALQILEIEFEDMRCKGVRLHRSYSIATPSLIKRFHELLKIKKFLIDTDVVMEEVPMTIEAVGDVLEPESY